MDEKIFLMKRIWVILLFVFPLLAEGQSLKKAEKKTLRGEYELAIARYEKSIDKPKYAGEANFGIAEAYRLSNRIKEAKPYYEAAIKNGFRGEEAYYYLAFALKANGDYTGAENQLKRYLNMAKNEAMIALAEKELDNIAEIVLLDEKKSYYKVKNLAVINTPAAEYSPVYKDGTLFFTSNRFGGKTYKATGTPFTNIYRAKTKGARVDPETIELLGDDLNSPNANDGTLAFSPDGKTMIFAKGNTGKKKGTADVNLYISRYRNRAWSEPRMLSISNPKTWDSSPCFSRDGRTIYFSSLRDDPNAQGGIDLYSAHMDRRGRFGKVKNLGPDINTAGDDMFPYVANDGNLYFSSTGHPGFGGLDLFVAKRKGGEISIENLGKPMNSPSDDFGINLFKADRGFFASNRPEGKGDDDIWTFVNEDPDLKTVNYFLQGITMTRDENDKERILPNVRVMLIDFQQNILDEMVVGADGKFNFRVYENENYELMAEKQGKDAENYYVTRLAYTTIGKSVPQEELTQLVTDITFDTLIYLDKIILEKSIVLENIYYEFAKWDITPVAAQELDKLVNILIDNPEINIELSSHTDSVDTESYNMRLSQRRAESAVNYIIQAGISPTRIVARGYGETRPIAPNTNPDGTDNPEGRAKNRRTEFKVISISRKKSGKEGDEFDEDRFFNDDDDGGGR
jgi:outer membrane protein OmpA-like peptidoglycan-associated protein